MERHLSDAPIDAAEPTELELAILERDQWKDRALRSAADIENTKRRLEAQAEDAKTYAIQKFARELLGVADNLDRAIKVDRSVIDSEAGEVALLAGLELTQRTLLHAFSTFGVNLVNPQPGDAFDPNFHQAVMEQPSDDVAPGTISQVLQTGYSLSGRVLRAAMVVVASK
jgi:molecular chaperone GrpE